MEQAAKEVLKELQEKLVTTFESNVREYFQVPLTIVEVKKNNKKTVEEIDNELETMSWRQ